MKKIFFLFLTILLLASFLRLWHLGGVPISPNWDEVSFGYNAYSILQTGKDEYGVFLPIILRAFNTFPPAMYSYLTIPPLMLFGLTVFAIRIPSALMGILGVAGTFFLAKELFSLQSADTKKNNYLSLLSMFLLAISPWHIQFSRVAYESNTALTFCIFGLLFFLLGLKKSKWFLLSAIMYGLTLHTYTGARLFVVLFLLGLAWIFRRQLLSRKNSLIAPLIIFLLFLLPFLFLFFNHQGEAVIGRFNETNIFANSPTLQKNAIIEKPTILGLVFNNTITNNTLQIFGGYLSHFSLNWLFLTGDNDRHHAPSMGLLYLFELPLLLLGLGKVLRMKGAFRSIFFIWLFLTPLSAALTTEVPHAVRTLLILPIPQLASALGFLYLYNQIRKRSVVFQIASLIIGCSFVLFNIFQYTHLYFFQMNHEFSRAWEFGYSDAIDFIGQNDYKKVFISDRLEEPYIFFLFYTRYNPKTYIEKDGGTKIGIKKSFDRYYFGPIDWKKAQKNQKDLYVLNPAEAHSSPIQKIVHTIYNFDGSEAIVFAE